MAKVVTAADSTNMKGRNVLGRIWLAVTGQWHTSGAEDME